MTTGSGVKKIILALLVTLSVGNAASAEEWTHPDSEMTWRFFSPRPGMKVMLWSMNRVGHNWGPFDIPPNELGADTGAWRRITCKADEIICYAITDGKVHWGLHQDGSGKCDNCCYRCDGQIFRRSIVVGY
jgi:hypothetical protein